MTLEIILAFAGSLVLNAYLVIRLVMVRRDIKKVLSSTDELIQVWDSVSHVIDDMKDETNK